MGFKEEIQKLSIQINERRVHIINEEMTKQALIIPFLQVLGYDVFNPLEVRPEFIADFGKKKGEKVDYAIFKDNMPIMFIEAKPVDGNLVNHDAQLSRYFNAVPDVKLGVITNGIEYKFFTDLKTDNVMDETPFLVLNLTSLKDSDVETLARFKKDTYAREHLFKFAEELVYTSALNDNLKTQFKNPSDEFVRFLIKDLGDIRVTSNVIERFRPIVKKAISNAILDIVSQGLIQQGGATTPAEEATQPAEQAPGETKPPALVEGDEGPKIVEVSEDEIQVYDTVKGILSKAGKDVKDLNYKATSNYFTIYNQGVTRWLMRIQLRAQNKNLMCRLDMKAIEGMVDGLKFEPAPKGMGETRVYVNHVDDFKKLEKLVTACYDHAVKKEAPPVQAQG